MPGSASSGCTAPGKDLVADTARVTRPPRLSRRTGNVRRPSRQRGRPPRESGGAVRLAFIAVPAASSSWWADQIGGPALLRDEAVHQDPSHARSHAIFACSGYQTRCTAPTNLLMHGSVAVLGTIGHRPAAPLGGAPCPSRPGFVAAHLPPGGQPALAPGGGQKWAAGLNVPCADRALSRPLFATARTCATTVQMARSYSTIASSPLIRLYLLAAGCPTAAGAGVWATGGVGADLSLFTVFGLRILARRRGHAAADRHRPRPARRGGGSGRIPASLAARGFAVVISCWLSLLGMAASPSSDRRWLRMPTCQGDGALATDLAGSRQLILPSRAARAGAGSSPSAWRTTGGPLHPGAIALPCWSSPPFLLVAASFVHPLRRALRRVSAAGAFQSPGRGGLTCYPLAGGHAAARAGSAGGGAAAETASDRGLGSLRLACLSVVAGRRGARTPLLPGRSHASRHTSARPDTSAGSASWPPTEQPGDGVLKTKPSRTTMHLLGTGLPAAFDRLRDIALDIGYRLGQHPDRYRDHQPRAAETGPPRRPGRVVGVHPPAPAPTRSLSRPAGWQEIWRC